MPHDPVLAQTVRSFGINRDACDAQCNSKAVNKLDIRDLGARAEVEGTLVAAKAAQWESQPLTETFDFAARRRPECVLSRHRTPFLRVRPVV